MVQHLFRVTARFGRLLSLSVYLCLFSVCCGWAAGEKDFGWPEPTRECRPWTYNWWLGSAVDTNNLARELRRYRDAGLGGVHVIPIYGAKGAESRYLEYLSPAWFEAFRFCVEEAGRLDLGVDMTTGTGWCFGGPNVPKADGGWRLQTQILEPQDGQPLTNRWAAGSVIGLVAVSLDGARADLRQHLRGDGTLDWVPEKPGVKVYAMTATPQGPIVKRAAPGGAGPMINPFSRRAMTNFLARFTEALGQYNGPMPRSMYHDSFEYGSSWTPGMLAEFAQRRGYRLEERLPEFCRPADESGARVRCDYQETLSDLLVETVFPEWIAWCKSRGVRTRNQAHGSPGNLLDLYALADIPETEMFGRGTRDPLRSRFDERFEEGDRNPLISKFASSAAHTTGRKLVSAETGTWLAEHFCETLEELKCLVDLLFASGVNHVIYHGTCYSPDDAPWPGWLFYASTEMNPRNAIWRDAPVLNTYIERCQSLLQSGRPDNEVLLYWPLHDLWQSEPGPVNPLRVHDHRWITGQPVGAAARELWEGGIGFDYVSDRQLGTAAVTDAGATRLPGGEYRVVLVPSARYMPVPALRQLLGLARAGATILFENQVPQDVPGASALVERRAELKRLLEEVEFREANSFKEARLGKGRVLLGSLDSLMPAAGLEPEQACRHDGARFIRRRTDEGRIYFIANQGTNVMDGWYRLGTAARSVIVMEPLTGRSGLAETWPVAGGERVEVHLRLHPGHSILLKTFDKRVVHGPAWNWPDPTAEALALAGPWRVEFLEGGPVLPKPYETVALQSWTRSGDPETERFAGTAKYSLEFDAPEGAGPWMLDLGEVCHSARVRLNGEEIGCLIMHPYQVTFPGLKPGRNRLEVEVTNLSANRLRDMDKRKVPWRVFNDINFVSITYKPFDASTWPVMESGLLGPVVIRPVANKANTPKKQ